MSEEQLKAFITKVQADTSLQEQLNAEGADPVAVAKAAGFSITTEDLNSYSQSLSELSDKELESVAGGAWGQQEQPGAIGNTGWQGCGAGANTADMGICAISTPIK